MPASPSSPSPRLPSPPPIPEVQIGPKSPGMGPAPDVAALEAEDAAAKQDQGALRRIRPGTKAADMASGPPPTPLSELDSPFQLQEHLKDLFQQSIRPRDSPDATVQLSHEKALAIANPPEGVDRSLWLYELCRLLVIKVNELIVQFFNDSPPCSAQTCPEMRASEWQYLCAVHEPPKPCCAIDYCCHTLDWAATTLASNKHFPSRLKLGNEESGGSQQGVRQLTNIMRRVYRIFAHAWFQHRQVFWHVESHEGLYILFKTVCDVYSLIQEENYTIPPEAEGLIVEKREDEVQEGKAVLKKDGNEDDVKGEEVDATTLSTGATTRRHKHTPSMGSAVTTITEGDEEDDSTQSPVKEKASGPLDAISSSMTKDVPSVHVTKPAEKEEEPAAEKEPEAAGDEPGEEMKDVTVEGDDTSVESRVEEEKGEEPIN
ncbi:MOB kinase activator 1, partial [Lecanoromycetidae sp. Uapishka_2]